MLIKNDNYSNFLANVVLVKLLATFLTDDVEETAAADATLVASWMDIFEISLILSMKFHL